MSNARNLADLLAPGENTLQTVAIETDRIILNGTDGSATNAGDDLLLDASAASTDVGERFTYEDGTDDGSAVLSVGDLNLEMNKKSLMESEGGAVTTIIAQGLLKVWADYSGGGTPVAADSFNCSTITDVSTGRKNQAFTNNMRSANFFVIDGMIADGNSGSTRGGASHHFYTQASSSIEYAAMYGSTSASNGNFTDSHTVDGCGVAGDLA